MVQDRLRPGACVEIVQGSNFDQQLHEYREVDEDIRSYTTVRYIEATPGVPFGVRFSVPGKYFSSFIEADLQIDGKHVRLERAYRVDCGRAGWKCVFDSALKRINGRDTIQEFRFNSLPTGKTETLTSDFSDSVQDKRDDSKTVDGETKKHMKSMGTIVMHLCSGGRARPGRMFGCSSILSVH
jgi:hypothetical protein